MAKEPRQIRIESILGGHSPLTHFAGPGQFRNSRGINPSAPITDGPVDDHATVSSGLLRPIGTELATGTLGTTAMWIKATPKTEDIFMYDANGSVYSISFDSSPVNYTGLNDAGNENARGLGNGMEYYDNYMYFARNTTISRYGPLNGTPTFTQDYWGTTLGKAALTDTLYPLSGLGYRHPNHVLHRHSDGRLYIADVVDNTGTIHFIQTRKTTVEGDTNDGSTFDALHVGYGLHPTAMESYGELLVIAFSERFTSGETTSTQSNLRLPNAKVAFWDTTSDSVNQITWGEFPDAMVTAIKNINGVLYFFSANPAGVGLRLTRYVGGSTFEEVFQVETAYPPLPGAVDGAGDQLLFGGLSFVPDSAHGVVYSKGLSKNISDGIFSVACPPTLNSSQVTAISLVYDEVGVNVAAKASPIFAFANSSEKGLALIGQTYDNYVPLWWSETFRIGQPFKITKIRIPLAQPLDTVEKSFRVSFYTDSVAYTTVSPSAINSSTHGTTAMSIVLEPRNLTGDNDFWMELRWLGSELCVISLPITIEYELLDVRTTYANP